MDINIRFPPPEFGGELRARLDNIADQLRTIIVNESELQAGLDALTVQVEKILGEVGAARGTITTLQEAIAELEQQLGQSGSLTSLTQQKFDALRALVQQVDDQLPDQPAPSSAPADGG